MLVQEEISYLRDAVNTLAKRKTCKRRYIQAEETLTVSGVCDLLTAREGSSSKDSERPAKRVRAERHCSRCGKIRHNFCTCKVEIEDVDNSDTSK